MKKIIITGPESTGKSTLTKFIAEHFNTIYIPEYAREYVENLKRKYNYKDIVKIAEKQIYDLKKEYPEELKYIFFDTGLIITKIWFQEVYGKVPPFLQDALNEIKIDLYLLCYPDLDWEYDKIRENSGEKRFYLFEKYKQELENLNCKYFIIKGKGHFRHEKAIKIACSA